jgi:hypothetical protein
VSWRDAPLYVEVHDLARWTLGQTGSWSDRGARLLAAQVTAAVCDLLAAVSLTLTFPDTRAVDLATADRAVVRLRVLLRLGRDLGLLSPGGLRFAAGRLEAVGTRLPRSRRSAVSTAPGARPALETKAMPQAMPQAKTSSLEHCGSPNERLR